MSESDYRYFVKKPDSKRKSYSVACYILSDPNNRKAKTYVELPKQVANKLASINKGFLAGTYQALECETLINEAIAAEYRKSGVRSKVIADQVLSEANQKLLNAYWEDIYGARDQADEKTMLHKLKKALRLIEPLALSTASEAELFSTLKKNAKSNQERRHATDRLNQLLKYADRDFRLIKSKPEYEQVVHCNSAEFKIIHKALRTAILKDFAMTLFATGLRLSEALALTPSDYSDETLNGPCPLTC